MERTYEKMTKLEDFIKVIQKINNNKYIIGSLKEKVQIDSHKNTAKKEHEWLLIGKYETEQDFLLFGDSCECV